MLTLPQFHNNHALGKEWQLAEAGIKDGDEVAVVWCKPRTPPKVPAEESLPAESRSALPDKATVDAVTSAEAEVGCVVACLLPNLRRRAHLPCLMGLTALGIMPSAQMATCIYCINGLSLFR